VALKETRGEFYLQLLFGEAVAVRVDAASAGALHCAYANTQSSYRIIKRFDSLCRLEATCRAMAIGFLGDRCMEEGARFYAPRPVRARESKPEEAEHQKLAECSQLVKEIEYATTFPSVVAQIAARLTKDFYGIDVKKAAAVRLDAELKAEEARLTVQQRVVDQLRMRVRGAKKRRADAKKEVSVAVSAILHDEDEFDATEINASWEAILSPENGRVGQKRKHA
jgi:hypothetical protein